MLSRSLGTDNDAGVNSPALPGLFAPRSVAVYGASLDTAKLGHTLLANLRTGGGVDDITVVHPSATQIQGLNAQPSLDHRVDLAVVSVPSTAVHSAVRDATEAGAGTVIVLSSGFGETDDAGRAAEAELVAMARANGARLVGPNCMGVLSHMGDGRWLNGTYFWNLPLTPGGVSMVSQSGAFGGMFFSHVRQRGLGVAQFLSVGNAADVAVVDALQSMGADPHTKVIGVFAEGIRDGRRFIDVAREITARIPIVVLKAGKSAAGRAAAASHTGSLAGEHAVVRAALRRAGVIEARESDEFFDVLAALAGASTPPNPATCKPGARLAIVTISGGPSVLAADAAEVAGWSLPTPSDATVDIIRAHAPSFAAVGNPIDLTPQCPPSGFGPAIEAVFADPNFDAVLVIDCGLDRPELADGVVRGTQATGKPTAAFVLDVPVITQKFTDAGIAMLGSPERAARSLAALAGVR
jgi:acyl-CoA synthetase (NDP forming)